MKDIYGIIHKPIITEKGNIQKEDSNKVTFEVSRKANKIEIKNAVQGLLMLKSLM